MIPTTPAARKPGQKPAAGPFPAQRPKRGADQRQRGRLQQGQPVVKDKRRFAAQQQQGGQTDTRAEPAAHGIREENQSQKRSRDRDSPRRNQAHAPLHEYSALDTFQQRRQKAIVPFVQTRVTEQNRIAGIVCVKPFVGPDARIPVQRRRRVGIQRQKARDNQQEKEKPPRPNSGEPD